MEVLQTEGVFIDINRGSGPVVSYRSSVADPVTLQEYSQYHESTDVSSTTELVREFKRAISDAVEDFGDENTALLLSSATISGAYRLISMFPCDLPDPEIDIGPNGEVLFEWINTARYRFVISVDGSSRFTYAGLYNHSSRHGTEFLRDKLQPEIISAIARTYRKG